MTTIYGHTVQLAVQSQRAGPVSVQQIRLECTCGQVFASGLFTVDDPAHRARVSQEGWPLAKEHLERVKNSRHQQLRKDPAGTMAQSSQ